MNWRVLWESQGQNLGTVVGLKATSSASGVGSQDTLLKNAKVDIRRAMVPRLSRIYKGRGKLVRARERLAGARWRDSSPKNCESLKRTGGSRMVIYGGDLGCEENLVKVDVPVDHKAQGREHLAMVL